MTASLCAGFDALISSNETGFSSLFMAKIYKKKYKKQCPSTVYVDGII